MSAHLPPCPFEVLIVAKTRLGPAGACIGGITQLNTKGLALILLPELTGRTTQPHSAPRGNVAFWSEFAGRLCLVSADESSSHQFYAPHFGICIGKCHQPRI